MEFKKWLAENELEEGWRNALMMGPALAGMLGVGCGKAVDRPAPQPTPITVSDTSPRSKLDAAQSRADAWKKRMGAASQKRHKGTEKYIKGSSVTVDD